VDIEGLVNTAPVDEDGGREGKGMGGVVMTLSSDNLPMREAKLPITGNREPAPGLTQWSQVDIGSVCEGIWDGPHATPKPSEDGPVYLGIGNITEDGALDLSEVRHIAEDDWAEWTKRVTPQPGDIVFTYEATLNRYAMIPHGFRGCLGRRTALIRTNPLLVDRKYLFYQFFGAEWRDLINNNILSGSTVDRIPIARFPSFQVRLPSPPIQRKIASILSAYDDLIENNLRRMKILEEMAQSLYNEWFVDFRFPGHETVKMVDSPLGMVPEWWAICEVGHMIKRLSKGKAYKQDELSIEGAVPVVDQASSEISGFHDNEPDLDASPSSPVVAFGDHTCRMRIMTRPFSVGPNVVPFRAEPIPTTYCYFLIRGLIQTREYKRHWNDLAKKTVAVAPPSVAREFSTAVETNLAMQSVLEDANRQLRSTRDLLLPKLISGEIDVSDLDIDIGEDAA
jgi:type I restriction enzyme, S subunit